MVQMGRMTLKKVWSKTHCYIGVDSGVGVIVITLFRARMRNRAHAQLDATMWSCKSVEPSGYNLLKAEAQYQKGRFKPNIKSAGI